METPIHQLKKRERRGCFHRNLYIFIALRELKVSKLLNLLKNLLCLAASNY